MKKQYSTLEIELLRFGLTDVINAGLSNILEEENPDDGEYDADEG